MDGSMSGTRGFWKPMNRPGCNFGRYDVADACWQATKMQVLSSDLRSGVSYQSLGISTAANRYRRGGGDKC